MVLCKLHARKQSDREENLWALANNEDSSQSKAESKLVARSEKSASIISVF